MSDPAQTSDIALPHGLPLNNARGEMSAIAMMMVRHRNECS
jgi:hypothetical protein